MNFTQNFNDKDFLKNQHIDALCYLSVGKYVHAWEHTVKAHDNIAYGLTEINVRTRCHTCRLYRNVIHFWVEDYITSVSMSQEILQDSGYDAVYHAVNGAVKTNNAYMLELHVAAKNLC